MSEASAFHFCAVTRNKGVKCGTLIRYSATDTEDALRCCEGFFGVGNVLTITPLAAQDNAMTKIKDLPMNTPLSGSFVTIDGEKKELHFAYPVGKGEAIEPIRVSMMFVKERDGKDVKLEMPPTVIAYEDFLSLEISFDGDGN